MTGQQLEVTNVERFTDAGKAWRLGPGVAVLPRHEAAVNASAPL